MRCALRRVTVVAALCIRVFATLALTPPAKPTELTTEQQEKLKERDRLNVEVEKLRKDEKLTEAIPACEKKLAIEREVWGDLHDDVVTSLNQLAELREERKEWPAAKQQREEALRIQTKRFGEQHWRTGDARRAILDLNQREQLSSYDQALLREGKALNGQVVRLWRDGKFREALAIARTALDIRKNLLGNEHPDVAQSLLNLGAQLQALGDHAAARPYCEEALTINKKALGHEHPSTAEALARLGALLQSQADYVGARRHYEEALAIRKEALGHEHPDISTSLNNLGGLLLLEGDYGGARRHCEAALAINKKALGPEHPDTARSLHNLGILIGSQGDYTAAWPYFEQALAINKKALGTEHPHTAAILNSLGVHRLRQGDHAGARPFLEQALAIRKKALGHEHPDTARSLTTLGNLRESQGEYVEARPYYEQALAIRKKALGVEHPDTATCLDNLGSLLHSQGDYAGARPYFEEALAICKKVLGPEHPQTACSLNNLGRLLYSQGEYVVARPYCEEALGIWKKAVGSEHPDTSMSLYNLGVLLSSQGEYAEARPYYEQALASASKQLEFAAAGHSERQQRAMADELRNYLEAYLTLAAHNRVASADSYRPHLRWKGAVLARQVRRTGIEQDPQLQFRLEAYESVCRRLAHAWCQTPDPKQSQAWHDNLETLTNEKEKLEIELAGRSEAFKRQQELQKLTPEQLEASLPTGTALVDFREYRHSTPPPEKKGPMRVERRLLAFVVQRDRPLVRVELGPAAPVSAAVETWRKTYGADAAIGAELRRLVWQPLEEHLQDAKTLLISPDGVLARIPFAALPGKEPGTYLIEDERAIAVIPVPQLLPELLDPRPKTAESLLLVGDVQFDAAPETTEVAAKDDLKPSAPRGGSLDEMLKNMQPLPGTQAEVASIKDLFQRRFPMAPTADLREAEATEAAFRKQAPRHCYLHLATHGFFTPKETTAAQEKAEDRTEGMFRDRQEVTGWHPGLLSGLVLAGAKQPLDPTRDDGILTALEVAALDLSHVELAVLSACETGLGEVAGGEGILGLQRAFQTAGAKSVVATLWQVRDDAARTLMVDFYRNMWRNNMPNAEALRQAQLTMLREGVKRGLGADDHPADAKRRLPPYYWAGFVLSGDWR